MEKMAIVPITAKDALEQWDAGKPVPAFQVETTPERQQIVYAAAFDLIRGGVFGSTGELLPLSELRYFKGDLSDREFDVAKSIAHVAEASGWAKMLSQHIHRDSPAITIQKEIKE